MKRLFWTVAVCALPMAAVQSAAPAVVDARALRQAQREELINRIEPRALQHRETRISHFASIRDEKVLDLSLPPAWPPNAAASRLIVLDVLRELEPLTAASPEVDVLIREVNKQGGGVVDIYYSQLIDGIPVQELNRLQITRDGSVTASVSRLVKPGVADRGSVVIGRANADAIAEQAVVSATQDPNARTNLGSELTRVELHWRVSDDEVVPFWTYDDVPVWASHGAHYFMDVEINAITGEAIARDALADARNFLHRANVPDSRWHTDGRSLRSRVTTRASG